ncbi:MAG TPA: DUF3800 domain-containing protein [Candidatus Limnocylindrales bacterium]|nr:DUF3800 domain-containing protein [Candidatus Limnocylindrales bacterium]
MYIAYIDGSGRPEKDLEPKESFVLACVIAHESQWQYIDNKVNEIKLIHFPNLPVEDIEFHAKDMLNREGVFKRLAWDEIYAIFTSIFEFLREEKTDICIISTVIMKQKMYDGKDIETWAYRLLVERINKLLEKNNNKAVLAGMAPQYGIMIIDSCGIRQDIKLRKKITEMLKRGTYYSKLAYLIEDPLFTDSKWRNLSQLTDCIAYAVRKHFRNPPTPSFHDINWENYYQLLRNKFDKDEQGRVNGCGIKVFP